MKKSLILLKKSLILLVIALQCSLFASAQVMVQDAPPGSVNGKLVINGSVRQLEARLKNVSVILSRDNEGYGTWVQTEKQLTKGNGEFKFMLDLNSKYMIEVAREGYTTKKVEFDTEVYGLTNQPAPFDFIIDLVPDQDGLAYLKAVARVFYHVKKNEFDYQIDYTKEDMEKEAKTEQERIEKLEQQRKAAQEKALKPGE